MVAFTKGAPEKVSTMCHPKSLPNDFSMRLSQYAAQGFRVIALAYKELPVKFRWKEAQRAKRDVVSIAVKNIIWFYYNFILTGWVWFDVFGFIGDAKYAETGNESSDSDFA